MFRKPSIDCSYSSVYTFFKFPQICLFLQFIFFCITFQFSTSNSPDMTYFIISLLFIHPFKKKQKNNNNKNKKKKSQTNKQTKKKKKKKKKIQKKQQKNNNKKTKHNKKQKRTYFCYTTQFIKCLLWIYIKPNAAFNIATNFSLLVHVPM